MFPGEARLTLAWRKIQKLSLEDKQRSRDVKQVLLQRSSSICSPGCSRMLQRRHKHPICSCYFAGAEFLCFRRLHLCNLHFCSITFPLLISQLSKASFLQFLPRLQNLPPWLHRVFRYNIWIYRHSIQLSNSCFCHQQPFTGFYLYTYHHFQVSP